jgi:hypothetical protein
MEWDPALISAMPIMPVVDDRWWLRRDSVIIQVAVSTARVDGYLIDRRGRTRVGIKG